MKKYHVTLKYPNVRVTVEAENLDEAIELAVEKADDDFLRASDWLDAGVTQRRHRVATPR